LDVTKGTIKRGPNINTPSYYVNNGGNLLSMQNKLYAQGFGVNYDLNKTALNSISALSGASDAKTGSSGAGVSMSDSSRDASNTYHHKKILHCYNLADQEFSEIHEGIFSAGTRK
jgi:hypothetical protein